MDWIAIAVAAATGAVGGLLGGLAGSAIKSRNLRAAVIVAVAVGAATLGRILLTPYVEAEYLVRTDEFRPIIRLAPGHIDELKARLREAYENGGTEADFARAGFLWGKKYASARITDLFASRNDRLVLDSFDIYMKVFRGIYAHDQVACFEWFEGFVTSPDQLGFGAQEKSDIQRLLDEFALASAPGNEPVARTALDTTLQQQVVDRVRTQWDASKLDFDGLGKPRDDFPPARKANICYTGFAYFSEIQRLPANDRLRYLRSLFGHT